MRQNFTKATKRDAFLRAMGRCEDCGNKLRYGEAEYHHDKEAFLNGPATLANCIVLCGECHDRATKARRPAIDKTRRIEEKRMGLRKSSRPMRHPTLRKKMNGEVVAR